ncbi:hypothetical protein HID58_088926 [Brassica napus]|uniref:Uncharacterized protein n=1 Tax=Brassica napus TaxID=3708 RepID=A0ABQ7XXI6_BRANA|nr:hypothetical protein HID58_085486 [Brassica napus]KAH0860665.1 hypothetical protein HID58_088926 [Brassica napus]
MCLFHRSECQAAWSDAVLCSGWPSTLVGSYVRE